MRRADASSYHRTRLTNRHTFPANEPRESVSNGPQGQTPNCLASHPFKTGAAAAAAIIVFGDVGETSADCRRSKYCRQGRDWHYHRPSKRGSYD